MQCAQLFVSLLMHNRRHSVSQIGDPRITRFLIFRRSTENACSLLHEQSLQTPPGGVIVQYHLKTATRKHRGTYEWERSQVWTNSTPARGVKIWWCMPAKLQTLRVIPTHPTCVYSLVSSSILVVLSPGLLSGFTLIIFRSLLFLKSRPCGSASPATETH